MCLSLAGQIDQIDGPDALVDVDGSQRRVSLAVLQLEGHHPAPGDWVLIHTGFAVTLLDPAEGEAFVQLRREMESAAGEEGMQP